MYYPFDVVPSFWNKILELSNKGIICSIDKVRKEICETNNPDSLSKWCENDLSNDFFADSSSAVNFYAKIALWANNSSHFNQAAIDDFLATDLADPWLIAYAKENNLTIVTHEISQPQRKNRIKIPEPCIHFGVKYLSPIEMFRELGESF
jgi:predicted nuclease of predicted toxin-antitoxin system